MDQVSELDWNAGSLRSAIVLAATINELIFSGGIVPTRQTRVGVEDNVFSKSVQTRSPDLIRPALPAPTPSACNPQPRSRKIPSHVPLSEVGLSQHDYLGRVFSARLSVTNKPYATHARPPK